jgi:hypothetical protein
VRFRFFRLRFHFEAAGSLFFPAGKTGNVLRGAFGSIFRKIACVPECTDARTCEIRAGCPYARIFEPASIGESPSGFADWPRPFVFRASHLDARAVRPGERFHFDVHLFQLRDPVIAYFVLTFAQLGREGLGPGRGRATLIGVEQLDAAGQVVERLFDGRSLLGSGEFAATELSLEPAGDPVRRLVVRFLTPTELKLEQKIAARPEFGVLAARLRDRLSTLSDLYGDGPLGMDFAGFGERAAAVSMTRCELERVEVDRVSTRSGQRHSLGGFVGVAEYEGELGEFVPFLRAGRFCGVGRQTTWGKGEIAVG